MKKRNAAFIGGLATALLLLSGRLGVLAADGRSALVPLLPGVWVDWERGQLEATGSCAADLYAASAEVARIKAERLARLRAEERLRSGLKQLSHDERQRAHLAPFGGGEQVGRLDPGRAQSLTIDYAATGSVSLRLALPLAGAPLAAGSPDLGSSSPAMDGGGERRGLR
jgi:hypothetical protein